MSITGYILLWLTNILTDLLAKEHVSGEFAVNTVEALETTYNIFAWLDVFLPMDFIISLALATTVFYGYKFVLSIVNRCVELFKS